MKIISSMILFLAIHTVMLGQQQDRPTGQRAGKAMTYKIGDKVQDFELKNVDGTMKSLASIENAKGYIIIFTSNVCPYAVGYEQRVLELNNKMARRGYPVVAINPNSEKVEAGDSFTAMQEHAKELGMNFLYLKDDKGLYNKFGATKTPEVFILDNNMVLQYKGAIDDNARDANGLEERFVENAVMAMENGESPSPNTTKAIGCSIKTENSGGGKGRRGGPPSADELLSRMDANKDGKLSKDEAKGPLAQDFASLDANNDGMLTKEELTKMKPKGSGGRN
jgi:peroxiredoxin